MADASSPLVLGDYINLQRGNTYKSSLLGQPGPILLGLASIARNGGFRSDNLKSYGGKSDPRMLLEPGDIYVSLKDVTQSADLLGAVSRVPRSIRQGRLTQDTVKLIFKSRSAPRDYLYWLLRTPQYREFCRARATGTTNLGLSRDDFLSFPVPPVTAERSEIVRALQTLDGKIDLNRRMNETLEAMARAIFKDWFVDFGPTRAKSEGRAPYLAPEIWALFPHRLGEENKPEGWASTKLGTLCSRVAMGPFGSDITTDNFIDHGVPVVRGGNLKNGFVDADFVFVSEAKADALKNANAFPDDIVITHRGTLGQVGIIPRNAQYRRYVASQSQMLISADRAKTSSRFLFEFLRSDDGMHQLLAHTSQTGVPAIARPTTSLKTLDVTLPPKEIVLHFDKLLKPLVDREVANTVEMRSLSALLDLLLPKLVPGGIRAEDTEMIAELAA